MDTEAAKAARQFHNRRGFKVRIECDRAVKASRLGLAADGDSRIVTVKLLYIGAADGRPAALQPDNDPYVYTHLRSPFPEQTRQYVTWQIFQDAHGDLWADYYSHVYLKDPAILSAGLLVEYEVPEILAVKKPKVTVTVNDDVLYAETVETAGVHRVTLDVRQVDAALIRYMQKVRERQRVLLAEFTRVCRKYGLTWYLVCGGLIGAMRDGDLLPWDDDLDIAMPRKDYDLLCAAARKEWPPGADFLLMKPEDLGKNVFLDFMTRLVDMGDTVDGDPFARMRDAGRQDIRQHLPMDIYVLDAASKSARLHSLRSKKLQALYVLALGHRPAFQPDEHTEYGKGTLFAVKMLQKAGRLLPLSALLRSWKRTAAACAGKKTGWLFLSNGYYRCFGDRYPAEWFGSGRQETVGGLTLQVPDRAEAYLNKMYGNYLQYYHPWERRPMHREDARF